MRIRKEWSAWDSKANFKDLPGAMGIFEIADENRKTIYIGFAGGGSPYGLRGELYRIFGTPAGAEKWNWSHPRPEGVPAALKQQARFYRWEVNHQYYSRWIEDLSRFKEDNGDLPLVNRDPSVEQPPRLGRYHWQLAGE